MYENVKVGDFLLFYMGFSLLMKLAYFEIKGYSQKYVIS